MSNMEFIYQNYINTTTMCSATTGQTTVQYLFDRKTSIPFKSVNDDDDTTTTTLKIGFSTSQYVDRIALQSINLKEFKIYYNSNTANTFTIVSGETSTSSWISNSTTNIYLKLNQTYTCNDIYVTMTKTIVANEEKEIGEIWISGKIMSFELNPSVNDYKPKLDRKSYEHEMSDGGIATYIIQDNFSASIQRTFVSETEHDTLWDIFGLYTPIVFVPFPTGTSWDNRIYEVNWTGDFDFEKYQTNDITQGYNGTMTLRETPK